MHWFPHRSALVLLLTHHEESASEAIKTGLILLDIASEYLPARQLGIQQGHLRGVSRCCRREMVEYCETPIIARRVIYATDVAMFDMFLCFACPCARLRIVGKFCVREMIWVVSTRDSLQRGQKLSTSAGSR